jgi:hypothetical protein
MILTSDEQRFMGFFRNQTFALAADSARPIDDSVSDSRLTSTPSVST